MAELPKRWLRGRRRRHTSPGAPPGTLIAVPEAAPPVVTAIGYGPDTIEEVRVESAAALQALKDKFDVLWVNVDGLGDVQVVDWVGDTFGLHRLALEDVLHLAQRPKVEDYDNHLFIIVRMPDVARTFETEQMAIFLGQGFVITFQEQAGDHFDPVRNRLRTNRGRIRGLGADYLAYALIDAAVDAYFPVLEQYGEEVERLEQQVLVRSGRAMVREIHAAKRDLLMLRRAVWPHRDMLSALIREQSDFVSDQTRIYLRDCYDHAIQLVEITETYRELASDLVDIYLSSQSHHMNEVVKVLTIIATIFIPLSFITGVYGMNFDYEASSWNMPELRWRFGYPFALGLMLAVAGGLIGYFWHRGWLVDRRQR